MIREDDLVFVRVADASDEKNVVALVPYRLNLIFACRINAISSLKVEFDLRSHGFDRLSRGVCC
jgi:hypothetical protein